MADDWAILAPAAGLWRRKILKNRRSSISNPDVTLGGGRWESRAFSLRLIKLCSLLWGTRTERADVQEEISHYRHSGERLSASASSMTLKNAAWKRVELFMACKRLRASSWAHTPRLASLLGSEISAGGQAECCCCCTLSVSAEMDAGCQDLQLCRKLMRVW